MKTALTIMDFTNNRHAHVVVIAPSVQRAVRDLQPLSLGLNHEDICNNNNALLSCG